MKPTITNQLKVCMANRGINRSQLARRLGKSRSYVTKLVNGEVRPGIETALRIARYFERPVEEVFQLDEKTVP